MEKQSKEMRNLCKSIEAWMKKYDGNVSFIGSFCAFDKKDNVIDDRIFTYGVKECIKEQIKALLELYRDEKGDFVNC